MPSPQGHGVGQSQISSHCSLTSNHSPQSPRLTYQPSWEAPASGPRVAARRREPWTAAHLGPVRAKTQLHSHPASMFRGARAPSPPPLPSHQESGGEGGVGAPVPGVCEPFYPWILWFRASFLQGSSWQSPARNSDNMGTVKDPLMSLSCPASHRASGCKTWEGDILLIKFTSHPKLPGADRETEASKQDLPKVTPCPPRIPSKPSPPPSRLAGCPLK